MRKIFHRLIGSIWMRGALATLFLANIAFGQTVATSQNVNLQAFQQEQMALMTERQQLVARGATPEQLQAWRQRNAARFADQQQRAQAMSNASALQPRPLVKEAFIPTNASPALKAYLTTQASLANAQAQIHNQLIQSMPSNATSAQMGEMEQKGIELFRKQHAADLKLQSQRAQTMAQESAQQLLREPPPLRIASDATPQMSAFLTTRDQLRREEIQLHNQYATADPATREAAMRQWKQQNAAQLQQQPQRVQTLSQGSSVNQK